MNKILFLSMMIVVLSQSNSAEANDLLIPERWKANTAGKLTFSTDQSDNSLKVKAQFSAENDGLKNWAYPLLVFKKSELPSKPKMLSVDLKYKCENNEVPRTFKIMLGIIDGQGNKSSHSFSCLPLQGWKNSEWKNFTFDLIPVLNDDKRLISMNIGMGAKGKTFEYQVKDLKFSGDGVQRIDVSSVVKVTTDEPAMFHNFGKPVMFKFTLPDDAEINYKIVNYRDETILEGEVPANRELAISDLAPDYYRLILNGKGVIFENFRSFSVFDQPSKREWVNNPFGADTAWGGSLGFFKNPANDQELQVENWAEYWTRVTELCNFSRIRMRGSWIGFERQPGVYKMDANTQKLIDKCTERNIRYSMLFHDAPRFLKRKNSKSLLPVNPFDTWKFMREYASVQGPTCEGIEFYNELDHSDLSLCPTWEVAAHIKAAYLGIKASARKDLKLIPVSSTLNISAGRWQWELFDQDLTSYVDAFNHHVYDPIPSIETRWKCDFRNFVAKHDAPSMGTWVTENSTRSEGAGMTVYAIDAEGNPKYDHSWEQELMLAEFHAKMMIAAQFAGVEADFLFLMRPYDEGTKRWGSVRWKDFSAKPTLPILKEMIKQIGHAKLLGEYKLTDKQRAFLYQLPDGSQTLMFWTRTEVEGNGSVLAGAVKGMSDHKSSTFSLELPADAKCFGAFGAPEKLNIKSNASTEVTAYRLPAYLTGLSGLKANIPFEQPDFSGAVDLGRDKSIVFQIESDLPVLFAGDALLVDAGATPKFVLKCHNFSNEKKVGKVNVSGAKFTKIPERVTLEPMSTTNIELELSADNQSVMPKLVFEGEFNNQKTTRLIMPVYRRDLVKDRNYFVLIGSEEKNFQGAKAELTVPKYQGDIKGIEFDVFTPEDRKLAGGIKLIHYTLTDKNGKTRSISWGKYAARNGDWQNNLLRIAANQGEKLTKVEIEPIFLPRNGYLKLRNVKLIIDKN